MLEDRPPGTEIRVGFLLSVSDIYNWWKNRNKPEMEKLNDSSEYTCGTNSFTRPCEIDKRIDAAIASADGKRNGQGEKGDCADGCIGCNRR